MLTFLNIAFLLGLPLVAVPSIVHLLNRRRRDVIDWGAMDFLLEALPRKRRFWHADDRMLMLLRCLALLLFVLAMARPMVRWRWFDTTGQRDVVLIIDHSMSTAQQAGQATAFDQITRRAIALVSDLNENDRVRLLLAGQTPQWLMTEFLPLTAENRAELRAHLRPLKPSLGSADWIRCLEEAAAALDAAQSVHGIIVLTDGQAHGWRAEAGPIWRRFHGTVDSTRGGCIVNIVSAAGPASAPNLSISSITSLRSRVGVGEPISFTATVRNNGTSPSEPAMLAWSQGQTSLGVSQLKPLAPGENTAVGFEHAFDVAGVFDIRARIDRHDALDADNEWSHVVEVVDALPILIVDGSGADNVIENQVHYLVAALGRQHEKENQRWRSVFVPEVINAPAFSEHALSHYPAVVLANVSQLQPAVVRQLHHFVEAGGGLWLLPGDDLDRAGFNATFCSGPDALIPVALDIPTGAEGDDEHFERIIPPVEPHPATFLLADTQRLDLDRVQISRHYRLTLPAADKQTSVLLRLSDNSPLAVHRPLDRGHVILQTVPMGTSWSNIPLHQAFVVWVNEWLAWLGSPKATQWNLQPGQPITVSLDKTFAADGQLLTSSGETWTLRSELLDEHRVFRCAATTAPGRYELDITDGSGDKRALPIVVERDPEESDLTSRSAAHEQALTSAADLHFVTNPLENIKNVGPAALRSEPAWTLLFASLIVLMIAELMLAGHLTRRRLAPVAAIERESIVRPLKVAAHSA